jgi:hypothetical protein
VREEEAAVLGEPRLSCDDVRGERKDESGGWGGEGTGKLFQCEGKVMLGGAGQSRAKLQRFTFHLACSAARWGGA